MPEELFHNPYHSVPLSDKDGPASIPLLPSKDFALGLPAHVTHDRWTTDALSGRIVCSLTTVTPLVIGGRQSQPANGGVTTIHPFTEGDQGNTPLIPPSTLRGLISSIAEAASNSALRVMEDRIFSFRRGMQEGLSAMGMIVEKDGAMHLYPLSQPHFEAKGNTPPSPFPRNTPLPRTGGNYAVMFPAEKCKVYFGTPADIRSPRFLNQFMTNSVATGGPFYGLPKATPHGAKIKTKNTNQGALHFHLGHSTTATPKVWDTISDADRAQYTRGILRVLGVDLTSTDRNEGMGTKEHEFFFPFSDSEEVQLKSGTAKIYKVTDAALSRFNQLADERTQTQKDGTPALDLLPFTPNGQTRGSGAPAEKRPRNAYHLKPGDIVFFRPSEDGKTVVEVSLSSIWRDRVKHDDEKGQSTATRLSDFIAATNPNLLPVGHPLKQKLTVAEQLLGFVENKGTRALAGRIRPSIGVPASNQGSLLHSGWVDLQVLNSPKPPSPALYFRNKNGQGAYIKKSDLNKGAHTIHGRKMYLHAQNAAAKTNPADPQWSMHPNNVNGGTLNNVRVKVKPILAEKKFWFHLDFENLSPLELGLLCYALQPNGAFHHKLGMGKPLGLGTVKIEPQALLFINRHERYSKDTLFSTPRYHRVWRPQDAADLPSAYKKVADKAPIKVGADDAAESCAGLKAVFTNALKAIDTTGHTLKVVEKLGDPASVQHPVHYPQVLGRNGAASELERYKWFVANDDRNNNQRQFLKPVGETLPTFKRL